MVTLSVNFDNSNNFFFEGEKISAKLEVSVDRPVNISSILAYFTGECCCNSDFDIEKNSKLNERTEREIYFNDVISLFVATNEESSLFNKGIHPFGMEFQLPCSLPTSVESPQGHIRYSLHVVANVSGSVIKTTHYFTVVSKVDLNRDSTANLPIVLWRHDNQCIFSFLCLSSGPVRAFVHIAKKGFVPGERLIINAEVRNFNRLPINWVKASIVQVFKYNCAKTVKRKRVVSEVIRGCILPHDSQAWISENLYIPAVPPTTYPPKRMISVKYKFYFLIKTSWQEKTLTLKENLIIGAVPLMECKEAEERGQGEGEGVANNYQCQYSNLEPCIFGPHSIQDEGQTSFSPFYPIYSETFNV